MDEINLTINRANFEETKKAAKDQDIESWGEKDSTGYNYQNLQLKIDETSFENGTIKMSGELTTNNGKTNLEFGYIAVEMDFCIELAIPIIEYYLKQVNKMKTILEAVK